MQVNSLGALHVDIADPKIEKITSPGSTQHLNFLDGLRGLAALYVCMHHGLLYYKDSTNKLVAFLVQVFNKGHFAVDVFIVLSGFCLMLQVVKNNGRLKNGYIDFIYKRAKRIIPTYYLAMIFSLALIGTLIGNKTGTHWDASIPVTSWDIFTHVFLLQDLFFITNTKINHVFWSIAVEWKIYFLFPLLVVLYRKYGSLIITGAALLLSLLIFYSLAYTRLNNTAWGINPHYLALFAFGMIGAQISFSSSAIYRRISNLVPWKMMMIVFLVSGCVLESHIVGSWALGDIAIGLSTVCLLIPVSCKKSRAFHRFLSLKPIVFLGTFGYSIYLIHAPLVQLFYQYILVNLHVSPVISVLLFTVVEVPVVLFICYLFFLAAEKPFITKKAKTLHASASHGG